MRVERQVLFWGAALLALVVAIGVLRDILLPFVAGATLAYFLNPLADRLTRLGLRRSWGRSSSSRSARSCSSPCSSSSSLSSSRKCSSSRSRCPASSERLKALLEASARERLGSSFPEFEAALQRASRALAENWGGLIAWAAQSLWDRSLALFNFLSLLLVTPLVVFYLLVDWHPMLAKIDRWLPRDHAPVIRRLGNDVNDAVSAFIRGQGTVCLILGVFYAAMLSAAGLEYGLLVGLATGVLAFIPFVGWALGLITATVLAAVQFWPDLVPMAIVVGIFLAGQALDAAVLSPRIVGSKIGLHPVWLIFSLFVFSYLFGFVGALVAVPVAAAMGVLVRFALDLYLASAVYQGREECLDAAVRPEGAGR